MSKTVSLLSALLCTFIWGTTFIAQDTGMDDIGPFTFNAVRFFVGFLAIAPLVFLCGTLYFLQILFKNLTDGNFLLFIPSVQNILAEVFLTGFFAPLICSKLFRIFKFSSRE